MSPNQGNPKIDATKIILGAIVSVVVIVGTVFGISQSFVSKSTYDSTIAGMNARLDRMEDKLDRVLYLAQENRKDNKDNITRRRN